MRTEELTDQMMLLAARYGSVRASVHRDGRRLSEAGHAELGAALEGCAVILGIVIDDLARLAENAENAENAEIAENAENAENAEIDENDEEEGGEWDD